MTLPTLDALHEAARAATRERDEAERADAELDEDGDSFLVTRLRGLVWPPPRQLVLRFVDYNGEGVVMNGFSMAAFGGFDSTFLEDDPPFDLAFHYELFPWADANGIPRSSLLFGLAGRTQLRWSTSLRQRDALLQAGAVLLALSVPEHAMLLGMNECVFDARQARVLRRFRASPATLPPP